MGFKIKNRRLTLTFKTLKGNSCENKIVKDLKSKPTFYGFKSRRK